MAGYDRAAPFYDAFAADEDVDLFTDYARGVGTVLDVGAGTGRVAVRMAQTGCTVTCVEPSPAMRDEFEEKLAADPDLFEGITLRDGTAQSFALEQRFPLVVMAGTFDHFLDHAERVTALRNVASHLTPDGTLVFDVFVGLMEPQERTMAGHVVEGDREYRRYVERELNDDTASVTLTYEVLVDDEVVERVVQRSRTGVCDRDAVIDCLTEAGFTVVHEYGDYDRAPYERGDELLVIEATPERQQ